MATTLQRYASRLSATAMAAGVLLSCGGGDDTDATPSPAATPTDTPAATATAMPTATPSPAPTPIPTPGPLEVPSGVGVTPAFPGLPPLGAPVAMIEVPGQEYFLVAVQDGRVFGFPKHGPFDDFWTVLDHRGSTRVSFEEGMLSLAVDPAFAETGQVYLYYVRAGGERRSMITRMEASATGDMFTLDPATEEIVLEVPQPFVNHNGGQIKFGPDGMLYLGLGDGGGGGDSGGNAQAPHRNLLGTVIRIDVREPAADALYSIPADNPFIESENALPEVWAYGFRNPWRMSFDRETGDLWLADVGERGWEEVNLVDRGNNYGWPIMEGPACFADPNCDQEGLVPPIVAYQHNVGCSITGGYVYRGAAHPSLQGWYVYSDWCSGTVWGIDAALAARGKPVEPHVLFQGPRAVSFAEDTDGELYIITFSNGGAIFRVTVDGG